MKTLPRKALLSCGAAVGAIAFATGAWAQQRAFDIPAQPATQAVPEFARQAGIQIMSPGADLRGVRLQAVKGEYDVRAALAMMLANTGLTIDSDNGSVIVLKKAAQDPQGGSAATGGATVEALIVTAQKREEDIQDVPIAISAFSQEALERSQVAGGPDLITQVPNMTFTKTNFASYSIQIRGIGTQAISATTDPGVAVAFNNTPFIRNRFFEQEFYDLQRVEVLRGPQGTLYGRNATAGVVNIISQKPKFNFEAKLSGDVSNYNTTRLEGMVNIPLVEDAVALRLAGAWTKRDGYSFNEITGEPIDGRDLWSTRVTLRVSPNDRINANLIWEHFEEDDDRLRSGKQLCKKHIVTEINGVSLPGPSFNPPLPDAGQTGWPAQTTLSQGCERVSLYSPEAFQTPNGASVPYYVPISFLGFPRPDDRLDPYANQVQSRDLRVIESTIDPIYRAKSDIGELQVSFDLTETLTLASETAYSTDMVYSLQDLNRFNTSPGAFGGRNADLDYIPAGILTPDYEFCDPQLGCSDRLIAVDLSSAKTRNFSQELRLSSDFDGPFNFSLGANFLRYDTEDKYYVFINSITLTAITNNNIQKVYSPSNPYIPGVSDNSECSTHGVRERDPLDSFSYNCTIVETNSIESIQDQGHNYFLSRNPYKLISYAVFGEAYYNLTDNLKVTGGLRWTVDKKEAPRRPSAILAGESIGHPVLEVVEQEWREPSGRLAIDWKPDLAFTDETLLYASYARGYKAGGANPPPLTPIQQDARDFGRPHISESRPKTFAPEFVDAFELGAKNTLLDGTVTLNLAAFYYDYRDYQISEIVDRSAFNRNFDATIWGIEIEADWRPLENLKLGFKGGYENTRIADGERAIDLMDRTAGNDEWVVVRPFPTYASNCILPAWLYTRPNGTLTGIGSPSGGGPAGCEIAYLAGLDPHTREPYEPNPTGPFPSGSTAYPGYPGWDPSTAPNNGEGFFKDLSGNALPNAPEFTATLTADYTVPLPNDWLATLHTDLYWQSESWWRVFDDHEYGKLDEYFTMNLAAIFANEEAGWRVMAYVKNVFDRDSITGAFLFSDDTALTTNVFLTEPRLYGLRVTKAWSGGPLLGSFGARRDGPYPFTIELGGQVQRHDAPNALVAPSFIDEFSPALNPLGDQTADLDWGDGREVKLTYTPRSWTVSLGARYGKTNGSSPYVGRDEVGDRACQFTTAQCQSGAAIYVERYNYTVSTTADREEHGIVDFMVGKDIGLGIADRSTLSAGLRYVDLESTTRSHIYGAANWDIPYDQNQFFSKYEATHDQFTTRIEAEREFKGSGPVVNWEATHALLGDNDTGHLGLEWSLGGGVLFGKQKTTVSGEEVAEAFSQRVAIVVPQGGYVPDLVTTTPVNFERSDSVTVPTAAASLGLSYTVDRFRIGAGYRWERYFDAIDGGYSEKQAEDRTIDGPYFKLSVGFGG